MKWDKISLEIKKIKNQPYEEWFFFYVSNWFLAETRTLKMLYVHSMNVRQANGIELFGRNYRTMLLGCLLASKLWEGWEMLRNSYFNTNIDNKYGSDYEQSARNELNNIKRYFTRDNTIMYKLRHSTFHYPTNRAEREEFKKFFNSYSNQGKSFYFITDTYEQSMFSIDHFITNFIKRIGTNNVQEGIKKLHNESMQLIRSFNIFLGNYIAIFSAKCKASRKKIVLEQIPKRLDVNIPFFTE